MGDRELLWDGLVNGRDMGGIAVGGGALIKRGRLVRSASPHHMTVQGWSDCVAHGVRSTLDLRHGWETEKAGVSSELRPPEVHELNYSLEPEGFIDTFRETKTEWKLATPVYYDDFVTNSPDRVAAAVQRIITAPDGGILVHCFAGRDRAGLLVAVLLDLLGVDHEVVIADHWMSFDRGEAIERTLKLNEMSGGILPLSAGQHAEILGAFLSSSPAERVFGEQVGTVSTSLLDRLA